jgi:branched-chain amino acid transport system permease protein
VRNPVSGRPIFIGDVIITKEQIWVFAGAILSSLIGLAIFGYAPLGRGLRAMAANARGAVLCGYSIDGMNAMAWFLGGALGGLAGIFAAPSEGISPELAISMTTAGFVAAVIGGFDSLRGALFGGLILGVAQTLAAAYVSSAMANAASFLLLFIVLLWRPEGLFPEAKIRDV